MNPVHGVGNSSPESTGQAGAHGWDRRSIPLVAVSAGAVLAAFLLPRMAQNPAYHLFADTRGWLLVPNFLNVASNIPFLLVGVMGLAFVLESHEKTARHPFADGRERWPYGIFFFGVALTSLGSSYYHLAPGNDRLVWDRLPMTIAFMGFFAAIIADRISVRMGFALILPFLIAGTGSVFYWHFTEQRGAGDLRPYALVQFYPLLAILLIMFLYPPHYTRGLEIVGALGFYALAKLFEVLDIQVLHQGGIVSGHTLKHLAAAFTPFLILRMLKRRESIVQLHP